MVNLLPFDSFCVTHHTDKSFYTEFAANSCQIFIILKPARIRNINPMKDDTLQRNNTGFPSGNGSSYYMEMPTFSALIKYIEKKIQSVRFHVLKTSLSVRMNPLGLIKCL